MLRSRRGQIVIPAMLLFPTLFLFVYLIYETAKISREKIRHQFAMDAAVFVEMTNYSDFLNRTAYVNGAFPMRIFEEGYWDFEAECEGKVQGCNKESFATMLFQNGAFPHLDGTYADGHSPETSISGGQWKIEYAPRFADKNALPPEVNTFVPDTPPDQSTSYELFTYKNTLNYWLPFTLATEIYKLYVQIYSLLGSVEDAQLQVLTRLATGHQFMLKSYYLNTGDSSGDAGALVTNFDAGLGDFMGSIHPACLKKLTFWGNRNNPGSAIQPYVPQRTSGDDAQGGIDMTKSGNGSQAGCGSVGGGLFQIEYLDNAMSSTLLNPNGIPINMAWTQDNLPKNFFNVDFAGMMAQRYPGRELHTSIKLMGANDTVFPSVWPDPTPKFQVRQLP